MSEKALRQKIKVWLEYFNNTYAECLSINICGLYLPLLSLQQLQKNERQQKSPTGRNKQAVRK